MCVFGHGFSVRGPFGTPAAAGGGRPRRLGVAAWARSRAGLSPRRAAARLPTPAEPLPKVSWGFKELSEERRGGRRGRELSRQQRSGK